MTLEEKIEFVDWALVPIEEITQEIIQKFSSSFSEIKIRIWFEQISFGSKIRFDEELYPGWLFFFSEEKLLIEFNKHNGILWCSHEIWVKFEENYSAIHKQIFNFIRKVFSLRFKNLKIEPNYTFFSAIDLLKMIYFPKTYNSLPLNVEEYFLKKEQNEQVN